MGSRQVPKDKGFRPSVNSEYYGELSSINRSSEIVLMKEGLRSNESATADSRDAWQLWSPTRHPVPA